MTERWAVAYAAAAVAECPNGPRTTTAGFEAQPCVMERLKRKFGAPSSQNTVNWNGALGGNRGSISAQWRKADFFADYASLVQTHGVQAQGLSGGIGFLNIGTDLGQQVLQPAR
jgi:hypothetical protein